jgi:hypothetical protein
MKPTFKQIEAARFYKTKIETAKEGLNSKGVDTSKMTREDLVLFIESIGVELPIELRTQNKEFVISNMDRILGDTPKRKKMSVKS